MARPLRLEFPGATYHVIVRGNERKAVFRDDVDRERYLGRLDLYRKTLGFSILGYCLMDNHVHMAIRAGKVPLSRLMARLQSSYTQYFNLRHRRVGHLFQGRYKAWLVEEDPYLLSLLRYIHENPVKAGMVERPHDYRWSSDRFYRGGRAPDWLDVETVLQMLGRTRRKAIGNYVSFMSRADPEPYEDAEIWAQSVKGDASFAESILSRFGEPPPKQRDLSIGKIVDEVCRLEKVGAKDLRSAGRGRRKSRARSLVAWAWREATGGSISAAAKYLGRDTSTLTVGVQQLELFMEADSAFRRRAEGMLSRLRASGARSQIRAADLGRAPQ